jgi:hypothetical protein
MASCLCDISLRHVDAERGEPGPSLFEKVEEASSPAVNVKKPEAARIASRENLVKWPQRLSPNSISRSIKKHFDLGIVTLRRFLRHPAARLEMKILKIVAGPFAACRLVQHFLVMAILAAAVDARQILEEQAQAVEQYGQGTVVIDGHRIDAGLDIG